VRQTSGIGRFLVALQLAKLHAGALAVVAAHDVGEAGVEHRDAGAASGLINVTQQVGGALGLAVLVVVLGVLIGRVGAASPNAASEANLDSITAVVIGGTSLFGGRGIIVGSLLGALIVGVFRNGLALAGVDVLYQTLVVGVLVIVAVATDQWIRRVRA